ncbi:MAG: hypothetical protein JSS69_02915 [Acidobacteria bacterium]|nr:hypothetical protein [Acidobacteriota bacterium]MBS1864844.1 hypothetical protein [Acidobacteriota bacterium]
MNSSSARRMGSVRQALSWRGPVIVTLLAVREIMRPLLYWHVWHIFETDISHQIPQPYGKEEAEVKFYTADEGLEALCQQISAMGELEPTEVSRRFAKGWLIAVAFLKAQPVGYMWLVLSGGMELAFDTYWIIRSGEALRYGSFVLPAFRGKGIHSILNHAVACYLREHNFHVTLASVSVLNPQSMSLARHNKRAIAMTVFIARIRGVNWTIRKSFGAPLQSRFSWRTE